MKTRLADKQHGRKVKSERAEPAVVKDKTARTRESPSPTPGRRAPRLSGFPELPISSLAPSFFSLRANVPLRRLPRARAVPCTRKIREQSATPPPTNYATCRRANDAFPGKSRGCTSPRKRESPAPYPLAHSAFTRRATRRSRTRAKTNNRQWFSAAAAATAAAGGNWMKEL